MDRVLNFPQIGQVTVILRDNAMPVKGATLDLDGTIIGPNETISPEVHNAVVELAALVPVLIATGREPTDAIRYARQLGLTTPQVSDGGAAILDPAIGQVIWAASLEKTYAEQIVRLLDRMSAAFVATHAKGTARTLDEVLDWDIVRVSALDLSHSAADALAAQFSGHPNVHAIKAKLPYNGLWAVDFTRAGVDKATGVAQVGRSIGVEAVDMAAVGDSFNDLPMLLSSGLSIAMGDAPDQVKAAADFVAPTVEEDGLALAIREHILPRVYGRT